MKALTQEPVTSGQLKQLTRMIGDIADSKAVQQALSLLDKEGAERLKGDPEFIASVQEFVTDRIKQLSVPNKFEDEEVDSKRGYFSGYGPKGLAEQCDRLRELIPGAGYANPLLLARFEKGEIPLPSDAEGWFAFPNIWKEGGHPVLGSSEAEALGVILGLISETRDGEFLNYREGEMTEDRLRQSRRTVRFLQERSRIQSDPDILIIAGQFGLLHRGRSVRRACELFRHDEFGFGAFMVAAMLLTHPERLALHDDLGIVCPGSEFDDPDPDTRKRFWSVPSFDTTGITVSLDACGIDEAGNHGSASGFAPQVMDLDH